MSAGTSNGVEFAGIELAKFSANSYPILPAPVLVDLPCLNNNNNSTKDPYKLCKSSRHKAAYALKENILGMVATFGIERIGVLTLTFANHVTDPKIASKRFNSLATHVLKDRYLCWVVVFERQQTGRIHFHLLVALREGDIRTGANFKEFEQRIYTSAAPQLRTEWAYWQEAAPAYGFGRTELLPIKSTAERIGDYFIKYLIKHIYSHIE